MSLADDIEKVFAVPLLRFLGARLVEQTPDGTARIAITLGPDSLNANDKAHAGTLYTLLDVVAYVALMPLLRPGQTAATHNMNASFMRATDSGTELVFVGRVLQAGRTTAFVQAEAFAGERRVAMATVCKSVIVLR